VRILCRIICIGRFIGRTIGVKNQIVSRVPEAIILVFFVCHQAKVVKKMMYVIVCLVALGASFLTLFSGFGLSTLLMPAFALFFPLEAAIAMTAVVHLANNAFKLALVGRKADKEVLLKFALPGIAAAIVAAFAGAFVGSKLLKKVTLRVVQLIVGVMLALIGISLAVGLI